MPEDLEAQGPAVRHALATLYADQVTESARTHTYEFYHRGGRKNLKNPFRG